MLDDEFLKERADIRAKMLKFSRAINEGKRTDEILAPDEIAKPGKSDNIFQKRLQKDKNSMRESFSENKNEKIYLKKDLINVKLEEKTSLTKRFFAKLKRKKTASKKPNALPQKKQGIAKLTLQANSHRENLQKPISKENSHKENSSKSSALNISPKIQKSLSSSSKPQNLVQPIQKKPQIHSSNSLKLPTEDNIKAKNVLLQGHSKATQDEKNLGKNQLLFAALCIIFAVVVFVPKIYITSNIYYLSRDIATLRTQESVLSEENKELNKRLENMRFQNQILDYLE